MQVELIEQRADVRPIKKVFFAIAVLAVFALAVYAVLSQTVYTVGAYPDRAECVSWDATYESLLSTAERFDTGAAEAWEHAYSYTGTLPSDDPRDYMNIYLYFTAENKSFIDSYTLGGTLSGAEKYGDRILFYSDADAAYSARLGRRESPGAKTAAGSSVILDVYVGGLTDEQIKELVGAVTLEVTAKGGIFGTKNVGVSFADCGSVTFDRGTNS